MSLWTMKEVIRMTGTTENALRYDNDFIAFDLIDESWVKINIVDEVVFDRTNSVEDFIKKHEESIS